MNILFKVICIILFPILLSIVFLYLADSTTNSISDSAKLTREYFDYGANINNDGKYNFLALDVTVDVKTPMEYTLSGSLYDFNNEEVVWSTYHNNLSPGFHIIHLNFDGEAIGKHGVDGPYRLKNVMLYSGSSFAGLNMCDYVLDAYSTSVYNSTDFADPKEDSEKRLSCSGSGEVLLSISVVRSQPIFFGNYSFDLIGIHLPPIISTFNVSFRPITNKLSGYAYDAEGIYMPAMPNNISVSATGVKNLNIGLKKQQGSYENSSNVWADKATRMWISAQEKADHHGVATIESYLLSPGIYHVKIFGDAAENVTKVNLTMTLVKKIVVSGPLNLSLNTTGFPDGDYSINLKAINGSFQLNELDLEDLPL